MTDEPAQMDHSASLLARGDTSPQEDIDDAEEAVNLRDNIKGDEDEDEDEDEDGSGDDEEGAEDEEEEEDDDEDEEEDEDEEDDDDDGLQATALHISALDLAGYG